jgi:hypothetical protein
MKLIKDRDTQGGEYGQLPYAVWWPRDAPYDSGEITFYYGESHDGIRSNLVEFHERYENWIEQESYRKKLEMEERIRTEQLLEKYAELHPEDW